MNVERLLEVYEKISEAPDAITRLRRFVLDLAVRGKLVEQDPADEPASELLKRIAGEKLRLTKAGEIKVRKVKALERTEPVAVDLPTGWSLTDLGTVALKITDGAHKTPTYVEKGVPFVSVKDFSAGRLSLANTRFISEAEHELLFQRCDPRRGDILLGRIGTLGKAVLVDTDIEFSLFVSVGLIRFDHDNLVPAFLRLLLNSPFVEAEFNRIKVGGGTHTNKLNLGDLHTVALLLPPLAEQHRIVAKVDELMALCDRLEEARKTREELRDKLTAASLARLTAPDTTAEDFPTHAAFALEALPALTTRPDQIKTLRQTILDLAVRGKLVQQDPADEPATALLKEANALKSKAGIKEKASSVDDSEIAFTAPLGWSWTRVGTIALQTGSGSTPRGGKSAYADKGTPFLRSQNIYDDGLRLDDVVFINDETNKKMKRTQVKAKDLLLNITGGSIGRCARIPDEFAGANISQHVAIIRTAAPGTEDYLHLLVRSPFFQSFVIGEQTGAGRGGLPKNRMDRIPVPLPPFAEQHRIVAKVDALIGLCDRLEVALITADTTRTRLLEALLQEALEPASEVLEAAE